MISLAFKNKYRVRRDLVLEPPFFLFQFLQGLRFEIDTRYFFFFRTRLFCSLNKRYIAFFSSLRHFFYISMLLRKAKSIHGNFSFKTSFIFFFMLHPLPTVTTDKREPRRVKSPPLNQAVVKKLQVWCRTSWHHPPISPKKYQKRRKKNTKIRRLSRSVRYENMRILFTSVYLDYIYSFSLSIYLSNYHHQL